MKSLPPLHDIAGMAGIELPEYLGQAKAIEPSIEPPMEEVASTSE